MENREFELLARRYMDMVFRLAFSYMKSASDADDVTQNVLLRLLRSTKPFESEEHARFWLVRVTMNECKRALRSQWRKAGDIEEYANELHFETQEHSDLFYAVMELPEKYRIVIHLFYYEDYSVREIAGILRITEANVKVRLSRGRRLLKEALQEVWTDE